jgi:hypothetical protein
MVTKIDRHVVIKSVYICDPLRSSDLNSYAAFGRGKTRRKNCVLNVTICYD